MTEFILLCDHFFIALIVILLVCELSRYFAKRATHSCHWEPTGVCHGVAAADPKASITTIVNRCTGCGLMHVDQVPGIFTLADLQLSVHTRDADILKQWGVKARG